MADVELIRKAHGFVYDKHRGQKRASGEPYVNHVEEVALLATKLKLDIPSVVTALLHDSVEDTSVTLADIERNFGLEISQLVDGVTKLSRLQFQSRLEREAENYRKMFLAMAEDIRVLLIKLCDRTHNMRTLQYLSENRRIRISRETLEIFAPLAHRLGIHWMKSELEDLSFRYLNPQTFDYIKQRVNQKKDERDSYTKQVVALIDQELRKYNIEGDISGRPKHFYSIYRKMQTQELLFEEIYDLIAFRILVTSVMECYSTVGAIHGAWKPIPGRFKDYIAMPKPNNYQSLHTTVIGPKGERIEIQIRTKDMHEVAERGIAAHWLYKEGKSGKGSGSREWRLDWIRDLIESNKIAGTPREFLEDIKDDLFEQEVYVFSPKGDLITMSVNATTLDFAYQVHTEVGNRCRAAKVNGQQVPISYRLKNGDTVEIVTSDNQVPNKDWLSIVETTKAKQRIRSWLKVEERKRSVEIGKEVLARDLKKVKKQLSAVEKRGELRPLAASMGFSEIELIYAQIAYGKLSTKQVIAKLIPEEVDLDSKLERDLSIFQKIVKGAVLSSKKKSGIKVSGIDDVVFHFAKCCDPLPDDEVVGYITRGRGVTVHRDNCRQTMSFDPHRLVPVQWNEEVESQRNIELVIRCVDKDGILAHMTKCISENGASIISANSSATSDGKGVNTFQIGIKSARQLERIKNKLKRIEGVVSVSGGSRENV